MKRSGIFALATASAMGVTALVGGIGYASALDVADQAGRSIDVKGVSTVDSGAGRLVGSPRLEPTAEPAPADDAAVEEDPDAVDEVAPPDPVVVDGTKEAGPDADTSWERSSDDRGGDRHGDHRSGKGGTHGHPGGGKHGGGGWGGGRR